MSATRWSIDPTHSSAAFEVQHIHISTYRGFFRSMKGQATLDDADPVACSIEVEIDPKSLVTDDQGLYQKMQGDDFFSSEMNPRITFKSARFEKLSEARWTVKGDLSMRGLARPIELTVEERGAMRNPFSQTLVRSFRITGELSRADWGMKWNVPLDNGAPYLGEKVKLDLSVELAKQR